MLVYEELSESNKNKCRKEVEHELRKHNKENVFEEAKNPMDVMKNVAKIAKLGIQAFSAIESATENPLWIVLETTIEGL